MQSRLGPIKIAASFAVGHGRPSLSLQVPWSGLGAVPVEAKIDRLFLLVSPKTEEERGSGVATEVRRLEQAGHEN